MQLTEGEAKIAELSKRMSAARAAEAAANGAPEAFQRAAEAVPPDTNHAAFEPAHTASAEVITVCADVKP